MRYWILLVPLLSAILMMACVTTTPRPGELQAFSQACEKSNEGELIAVEGYLRLPDTFTPGDSVELLLYRDLTFSGEPIGATISFGEGPNQAERISSSYQDSDLKIHLADGSPVPFGTKVRVSGSMYLPVVPQNFDCGLQNLYIEAAK